jgi:hypothetical protein
MRTFQFAWTIGILMLLALPVLAHPSHGMSAPHGHHEGLYFLLALAAVPWIVAWARNGGRK